MRLVSAVLTLPPFLRLIHGAKCPLRQESLEDVLVGRLRQFGELDDGAGVLVVHRYCGQEGIGGAMEGIVYY